MVSRNFSLASLSTLFMDIIVVLFASDIVYQLKDNPEYSVG